MSKPNRTAPIRKGFDYQDRWAFALCLELLKHPTRHFALRFETIPDEVESGKFHLEDIILVHSDETFTYFQIKHRQDAAGNPWTWKELLARENNKKGRLKDSLLQKWAQSLSAKGIKNYVQAGRLLTNGAADADLQKSLKSGHIDLKYLKRNFPGTAKELFTQLGSEAAAREFAAVFEFSFSQPDIHPLEQATREQLSRRFGATAAGMNNLLLAIAKECSRRHPKPWDLNAVTRNCEFSNPRPLNQEFSVPSDFQLLDARGHARILARLDNPAGGAQVFWGRPGSGKSTYLSWLYKQLRGSRHVVFRHHYHINPSDPNPLERLPAQRVIEALKAQFREQHKLLGSLAVQNAGSTSARDFLSQIASQLHKKGRAAILILDGLDHALRHEDAAELRELLQQVCVPQPGLWILLGTQLSARNCVPAIIHEHCPQSKWLELKGLTRQGVLAILRKNTLRLRLPRDIQQLHELAGAVFKLCAGNPLHLRYTLRALRSRSPSAQVTAYDCRGLVPYSGDIAKYYAALWRNLSTAAKSLALSLVCSSIEPTQVQILDWARLLQLPLDKASDALSEIRHLLRERRELLAIFHNSFRQFLLDSHDYGLLQQQLKRMLRTWLETTNNPTLKWAHLPILAYQLGDPSRLLSIDRNWLIDAHCHPHLPSQIDENLTFAAEAAFKKKDWAACLRFSTLRFYSDSAVEYNKDRYADAWGLAFRLSPEKTFDFPVDSLTPTQLVALTKEAAAGGRFDSIRDEVIAAIDHHHSDVRIGTKGEIGGVLPTIATATIDIVTHDSTFTTARLIRYIRQYDQQGWAPDLFGYAATRLLTRNYALVEQLAQKAVTAEKIEIDRACARHALINREKISLKCTSPAISLLGTIVRLLGGEAGGVIPSLLPQASFPLSVPEWESRHGNKRASNFYDGFLIGVACSLAKIPCPIDSWIAASDSQNWSHLAYSRLVKAGISVGLDLGAGRSVDFLQALKVLADIQPLKWPEDRDRIAYWHSVKIALEDISETLWDLLRYQGRTSSLSSAEFAGLQASPHLRRYNLINVLLRIGTPMLSAPQLVTLLSEERAAIVSSSDTFSERSSQVLRLAELAEIHGDHAQAREFLQKAVEYLLAYGSHKDMMLDTVMDSVRAAHVGLPHRTRAHINRLAPLILGVREYTDGDETGNFPEAFADLLAETIPSLLPGYVIDEINKESYWKAESILSSLVTALDLTDPYSRALAATAVDKGSFHALKQRAANDSRAAAIVQELQDYIGGLVFREEGVSSGLPPDDESDYAGISASQIAGKLKRADSPWDKSRLMSKWASHHLANGTIAAPAILTAIERYIKGMGIARVDGEILDVAYELAYTSNRERAFEYVVWAQAKTSGWDAYFTSASRTRQRWKFVLEKYPSRAHEFFEKSVNRTGLTYGRRSRYFFPLPRGIEFFSLRKDWGAIDSIVTTAVGIAESLVVDPLTPGPDWISGPTQDSLDVLIRRLSWPSPLVRERAANALAKLLTDRRYSQKTTDRLLAWISKRELESEVVHGLLPFSKASALQPTKVNVTVINKKLPLRSITAEYILEDIAERTGKRHLRKGYPLSLELPNRSFHPNEFFQKHIRSFLPPYYSNQAAEIDHKFNIPFTRTWAFNSGMLAKKLGIEESSEVLGFMGSPGRDMLLTFSSNLSEVYRSAYIRTLDYFHRIGRLPEDWFLDESLATIPIDISLWQINPVRRPNWWPSVPGALSDKNLIGLAFEDKCRDAISPQAGKVILGLSGAVVPPTAEDSSTASVQLIGFAYRIHGPKMPTAEMVAETLPKYCELTPPTKLKTPVSHLESFADHIPRTTTSFRVEDLEIRPLIGPFRMSTHPMWQWFRMQDGTPHGLDCGTFPGIQIRLQRDAVGFYFGGSEVGMTQDWTEGVMERSPDGARTPSGQFTTISEDFLGEALSRMGLKLGYLLKMDASIKPSGYGKPRQYYEQCRLLRVSPIIQP